MQCDYCYTEVEVLYEIFLNGTDDFYQLDVCEDCQDYLSDYFTPEEVDNMIRALYHKNK